MGLLIPDLMCKTVYDIPMAFFINNVISSVFLDIDNTLVSYNTKLPTRQNIEWLIDLQKIGIRIFFVSNNDAARVSLFVSECGIEAEFVADAHKPCTSAYLKVISKHDVDVKCACAIGDQLFTDVLAAKLLGMKAVTVEPVEKVENSFFRFKRACEVPFIKYYNYKTRQKRGSDSNV